MSGLEIRGATLADLRGIVATLRSNAASPELPQPSARRIERRIHHWLVARDEDRVTGVACLVHHERDLAELTALAVPPTRHRRGVGRALLREPPSRGGPERLVAVGRGSGRVLRTLRVRTGPGASAGAAVRAAPSRDVRATTPMALVAPRRAPGLPLRPRLTVDASRDAGAPELPPARASASRRFVLA